MLRTVIWALCLLVPVGWCSKGSRSRFWRNRRGGRVVFLSDVVSNVAEALHAAVFRIPDGARFVRERTGRIAGTVSPRRRRTRRKK